MPKFKAYGPIFEDDHCIIVNKASGVPVIPGRNSKDQSLLAILEQRTNTQLYTVHRIDKLTSGLIIFAKDKTSHQAFNQMFQNQMIEKAYRCICHGHASEEIIEINAPIFIDSRSPRVKIHPKGKVSFSIAKTIENSKQFSLMEVQIKTGRMHQVRIHLNHIGLPILSDPYYNSHPKLYLKDLKKNFKSGVNQVIKPLIDRTALHAFSLGFEHPITKENIYLEAELPKDLKVAWKLILQHDK